MGRATGQRPADRAAREDGVDRFAAAWLTGLGNDRTRAAYRSDLERFATWLRSRGVGSLADAGSGHVEQFTSALASDGEADSTMARRLSTLRSFYRYLASEGVIAESLPIPSPPGPGSEAKAGLSAEHVADLVASAQDLGSRTVALVGLLLFNGMRLDEVLACDADQVRIEPQSVKISVVRRDVPHVLDIDWWTAAAVGRYLGKRRDGPLLLGESPTRQARRLTRFGADYLIKRAGMAAGIGEPMSANTLRRTFVKTA